MFPVVPRLVDVNPCSEWGNCPQGCVALSWEPYHHCTCEDGAYELYTDTEKNKTYCVPKGEIITQLPFLCVRCIDNTKAGIPDISYFFVRNLFFCFYNFFSLFYQFLLVASKSCFKISKVFVFQRCYCISWFEYLNSFKYMVLTLYRLKLGKSDIWLDFHWF